MRTMMHHIGQISGIVITSLGIVAVAGAERSMVSRSCPVWSLCGLLLPKWRFSGSVPTEAPAEWLAIRRLLMPAGYSLQRMMNWLPARPLTG